MRRSLQCLRRLRWASFCRPSVSRPCFSEFPPSSTSYSWPLAPPLELLAAREAIDKTTAAHKPASVATTIEDSPLYCLYRLYEHLVLNHRFGLRDEIEFFWNHSSCFPIPRTRMRALCCSVMYPQHARQAFNREYWLWIALQCPCGYEQ